jgi:hypothetical protein
MPQYNWLEAVNVTEEMLLRTDQRLPVIWISALDCTGCKEAFTRSLEPTTLDTKLGCKGPIAFNGCESIDEDRCISAGLLYWLLGKRLLGQRWVLRQKEDIDEQKRHLCRVVEKTNQTFD